MPIPTRTRRSILAVTLLLLLAACAAPQPRSRTPATTSPEQNSHTVHATVPIEASGIPPAPQESTASNRTASPWERMRARFALPGCEYNAEVVRWADRFTESPARFSASWKSAMPFLLLVLDEIERRNLPGEFALLPYVESSYRPLPSPGQRPAGIWQLMPRTAVDRGLRISNDYDGRLDAIDSTRVALDLIERYDREFGDWRLATMAFNAGEYRIKRELGKRTAVDLPANELARFSISATSHEHLYKMLALACIVANPARFEVTLPDAEEDDHLAPQELDHAIDLRLVARFADLPLGEIRILNTAWLGNRMPPDAPKRVLIPRKHIDTFVASSHAISPSLHADWKSHRIKQPTPLADIAAAHSIAIDALAAANGLEADALVSSDTELLVPGLEAPLGASRPLAEMHIVRKGDTLSLIAQRYQVRIADLLKWNRLRANSVLRLGARLQLRSSD